MKYLQTYQNQLIFNQVRIKLLYPHIAKSFRNFNSISLNITVQKIPNMKSPLIMESFYFLEFFSLIKPFLKNEKRSYSEFQIDWSATLRNKNLLNLLNLLKLFYFPILSRKSIKPRSNIVHSNNYVLTLKALNSIFPFLPNIYFKDEYSLNMSFLLNKNYSKSESQLVLSYWDIK